jgi:putative ABC transport system ATP-binding protein
MAIRSMRQALDFGALTIMLMRGLDVAGPARAGLEVVDLVAWFGAVHFRQLEDDSLLLG